MRKIILILAMISTISVMADEPNKTSYSEKCASSDVSTTGVVVGGSVQTCVRTYSDGSKTVTEKTCGKAGVGGSVGFAKGSSTLSDCKVTETRYPANSSSGSSSNGSSCSTKTRFGQTVTSCKTESNKSNGGRYLGGK